MKNLKAKPVDLQQKLAHVNFDSLPELSPQDATAIQVAIQGEIRRICSHATPIVPAEPVHEQLSSGGRDGTTGDIDSHNTAIQSHQVHNTCKIVGDLKLNLQKLNEGTFGTCEECEEPIGKGRLLASRLAAVNCVHCQSTAEKNRQRGPGRLTAFA